MKLLFKKYLFLFVLLASIINIDIYMPISDSGTLKVAIVELFFSFAILFFVYIYFFKKNTISKDNRKLVLLIVSFLFIYFVITVIRFMLGYEFKQSLLAIKVSIFPIVLIFCADFFRIRKEYLVNNLVIFNLIINFFQLFYFTNIRMSPFMGNIMVFLTISCMLFPIGVFILTDQKSNILWKIIAYFNCFCACYFPLVSGARSSFFVSLLIVALAVIYLFLINRKVLCNLVMIVLLSFVCNIVIYKFFSLNVATYIERVLPFISVEKEPTKPITQDILDDVSAVSQSVSNFSENSIIVDQSSHTNNDFSDVVASEKDASDSLRKLIVKQSLNSFFESPLIGKGIIYFPVETNYGVSLQSAHNFILEYLNAYGFIGFVAYSIIYIFIIFRVFLSMKKRKIDIILFISSVCSLGMHSMVQPTMLIVPVVTLLFVIFSLFLNWSNVYEKKS